MNTDKLTVLCVGATGSVGRHVVEEALRRGHAVRALVRSRARGAGLPAQAQIAVGELTQPDTLAQAVAGVDAIVFTHGSNGGKADIPGKDKYKGPEAFRKRVMEGLSGPIDPALKEAVKRYAEGLLK